MDAGASAGASACPSSSFGASDGASSSARGSAGAGTASHPTLAMGSPVSTHSGSRGGVSSTAGTGAAWLRARRVMSSTSASTDAFSGSNGSMA